MLFNEENKWSPIPPKLKLFYKDLKLTAETNYYQIFDAFSCDDNRIYSIRALNTNSEFYQQNTNLAMTLFVQELLRLCVVHPESVLIDHFEIHEKNVAFVTEKCLSLPIITKEDDNPEKVDIEQLLKDVLTEVDFLIHDFTLPNPISIELQNIFFLAETGAYLLGDWASFFKEKECNTEMSIMVNKSNGADEIYTLGLRILELNGSQREHLDSLNALKNIQMHNGAIDAVIAGLTLPELTKKLLRKILNKDPCARPPLEEFATKSRRPRGFERVTEIGNGKEENKPVKPRERIALSDKRLVFSKVQRFKGLGSFSWNCKDEVDAIAFTCSKDIFITGVGLYTPKEENVTITGVVMLIVEENVLAIKEVRLENTGDKGFVYSVIFDEAIAIRTGETITCSCQLKGGGSYLGKQGMEKLLGEGDVEFTFMKAAACTNGTSTAIGQIPEIYYILPERLKV